uniref:Uncharacterized protein n=1 Tax=Zea mays TaxID=4577 RepID=A0A804QP18_MAIZE
RQRRQANGFPRWFEAARDARLLRPPVPVRLVVRSQEDAAACAYYGQEAAATGSVVVPAEPSGLVSGSPRPGGVPRRLARHRGLDSALPLRRHPQQRPPGWHAAAVQVGAAEDVPDRGQRRRRRRRGQPHAGLRLGDVQAVEAERHDVQLPHVRQPVRGHRRQRRHHRRDGHHAGPAGDVPDSAVPLRQEQGPDQGGERLLRPGDSDRRSDSGLRRAHAVVRLRRVSVPDDHRRAAAARGVPALQRLRRRQGRAAAEGALEHVHSGGRLQVLCVEWADRSEDPRRMVDRQRPQPARSVRRRLPPSPGQRLQMGREARAGCHRRPARSSRVAEPLGAQLVPRRHAGVGNHGRQHRADGAGHRFPRVQVRDEPEAAGGGAAERAAGAWSDPGQPHQNIDFVRTNFSGELAAVTTRDGPLTFVGEWVAEWKVPNATKEEYQKYAAAQMNVYGQATFGWAYWTAKNANNHWDLEWMIRNGYISLKG